MRITNRITFVSAALGLAFGTAALLETLNFAVLASPSPLIPGWLRGGSAMMGILAETLAVMHFKSTLTTAGSRTENRYPPRFQFQLSAALAVVAALAIALGVVVGDIRTDGAWHLIGLAAMWTFLETVDRASEPRNAEARNADTRPDKGVRNP
jgi:hypothetical protein